MRSRNLGMIQLLIRSCRKSLFSAPPLYRRRLSAMQIPDLYRTPSFFKSCIPLRFFSDGAFQGGNLENNQYPIYYDKDEEVQPIDSWEDEEETVPEIGDGGEGGGIVFRDCAWGEKALSLAHDVLQKFGDDMKLYAFKTSPGGYIYVRLDKLTNEYGCPSMKEIEDFCHQYKKRLEEVGATGEIPDDLALEVSSPGAERLLKVPEDLHRFKDMPMRVSYVEESDSKSTEKSGVFYLDVVDIESGICIWKLADVRENRGPSAKGRPLSRKRKDWRLKLPYSMLKRVNLYLDY